MLPGEGQEVTCKGIGYKVLKLSQDDSSQPRVRLEPLTTGTSIWRKVEDLDGYGHPIDQELARLKFVLRANDAEHVEAWRQMLHEMSSPLFEGLTTDEKHRFRESFEIQQANIFDGCTLANDDAAGGIGLEDTGTWAVVSPANSFGDMTGGIDAVYLQRWPDVMKNLQKLIRQERDGELVVGDALIVDTCKDAEEKIHYCIAAPTMRVPADVRGSCNAYLSFRAALVAVRRHNRAAKVSGEAQLINTVLSPMLATGVGRMPPRTVAFQMGMAYRQQVLMRHGCFNSASLDHKILVSDM